MDSIHFRKNVRGEVLINDIPTPFTISNKYFPLEEKLAISSLLFLSKLRLKIISVIAIGKEVVDKNKFLPFLVEDESLKKKKENQKIEFEINQKISKELENQYSLELEEKEKIHKEKIDLSQNKKNENLGNKVLDSSQFTNMVEEYLSMQGEEE